MTEPELRFELTDTAHALFTTRANGNLSSVGGDGAEHGEEARERLRVSIGVDRLTRGYQVHGTAVQQVMTASTSTGQDTQLAEADGQATTVRRLGAIVLTADCLPVALATQVAVAVLHAGWRGLAADVLEEGVRALQDMGGADGIVAMIGPGAGPCCYEVGEDVHQAFSGAHRFGANIDLKAIARDRLLAAGVSEVREVEACTICDERFFSYRREGPRAGRQGGVAWLS
jgi:polyphenol oxidase